MAELMHAIRECHAASGRRVTLALTAVAGINTTWSEDPRQLEVLLPGVAMGAKY